MNDWGTPDWRNASAYEVTADWHLWRWRWEFYRRRDDLREDYQNYVMDTYHAHIRLAKYIDGDYRSVPTIIKPGDKRFLVSAPDCQNKYGYISLPHPAYSDHSLSDLWPGRDIDEDVSFYWPPKEDYSVVPIGMDRKHFAVVFNIQKPLTPQLDAVKKELANRQKHFVGKVLQKRRSPDKWIEYLRALDANSEGASLSEIASILRKDQTQQAARDTLKAAQRLRFNF